MHEAISYAYYKDNRRGSQTSDAIIHLLFLLKDIVTLQSAEQGEDFDQKVESLLELLFKLVEDGDFVFDPTIVLRLLHDLKGWEAEAAEALGKVSVMGPEYLNSVIDLFVNPEEPEEERIYWNQRALRIIAQTNPPQSWWHSALQLGLWGVSEPQEEGPALEGPLFMSWKSLQEFLYWIKKRESFYTDKDYPDALFVTSEVYYRMRSGHHDSNAGDHWSIDFGATVPVIVIKDEELSVVTPDESGSLEAPKTWKKVSKSYLFDISQIADEVFKTYADQLYKPLWGDVIQDPNAPPNKIFAISHNTLHTPDTIPVSHSFYKKVKKEMEEHAKHVPPTTPGSSDPTGS